MYPDLFGNPALEMYNLIGALGYGLLLFFFLCRKTWPTDCGVGEKRRAVMVGLPLLVHLVGYTFGGRLLASLVNRGSEFLGYVAVSALGMVLAAVALGARPLRWLDTTVPLYLSAAALLKLSCFCAGCCRGLPWAYGLYNHQTQQLEFPIQLMEAVLYGALCLLFCRYKGRPGQRFALFLTGYAAVRFAVQFFRVDRAVFTPFHWLSAVFFAVGGLMWVLVTVCTAGKEAKQAE